jgi:hypothetical protein
MEKNKGERHAYLQWNKVLKLVKVVNNMEWGFKACQSDECEKGKGILVSSLY